MFCKRGKTGQFPLPIVLPVSLCFRRQKGAEPTHHSSDLPIRFLEAAWTKKQNKKGGIYGE